MSATAHFRVPPRPLGVLFVAAVECELRPLRRLLRREPLPCPVRVLVSGVGKTAAAVVLTEALLRLRPQLCIQLGCAGAYPARGLSLGDIVLAREEVLADEGVATARGFLTLEALGLSPPHRGASRRPAGSIGIRPPSVGALRSAEEASPGARVLSGRCVTVSTSSGTRALAAERERLWHPLAESMEGAAAALACRKARVRFIEVRGISNFVGPRRRGDWRIEEAVRGAARVALAVARAEVVRAKVVRAKVARSKVAPRSRSR